jgi:hypothetical protein
MGSRRRARKTASAALPPISAQPLRQVEAARGSLFQKVML